MHIKHFNTLSITLFMIIQFAWELPLRKETTVIRELVKNGRKGPCEGKAAEILSGIRMDR